MRKRRIKEGNVSIALLDVFFNMMIIFMLTALSAGSGSLTSLDISKDSAEEKLSTQRKEVAVEIVYSRKGWTVRVEGREIVPPGSLDRVINWLAKNKPPSVKLFFSGRSRIYPEELLTLILKAQEIGIQLFYQSQMG